MITAPVATSESKPMLTSIQKPERVLNILRSSTLIRRAVGMERTAGRSRTTGVTLSAVGEMVVAVMPQLLRAGCRQ